MYATLFLIVIYIVSHVHEVYDKEYDDRNEHVNKLLVSWIFIQIIDMFMYNTIFTVRLEKMITSELLSRHTKVKKLINVQRCISILNIGVICYVLYTRLLQLR